jgi:methanogenic corrinoid protein MtbC1
MFLLCETMYWRTTATQLIMSQLYPYIFSTVNSGRRLVATCVGGELHEIGIRMVADFFEMAGWDTYYLGANTPDRSLLQTVEDKKPDILALSTTMTFNVSAVADLIRLVRQSETIAAMKIIVGGYPFNLSAGLWQKVGANGCAKDAQQAIVLAEELVENET